MAAIVEEWVDLSGDGGVMKRIIQEGSGNFPLKGDEIRAHYTGTLESDGSKFDSSRDRGTEFKFKVGKGNVIKGWDIGFATMKVGEKAILKCKPDYAYGAMGQGTIPPNSTLIFDVEMFGFSKPKKEQWEYTNEEKIAEGSQFKEQGKFNLVQASSYL